ncbi:ArsR/SmtB family transcription factor [Nakamurella aerolata]|uniref:Helix-turn-helix transcriptional regulator n=1 Tax=Nakamurella aerolata TaxID=1656892 RepID=A0A849A727_9ACTN|nr:helix-turn-helix domain-containing protein [Nakamurella aerolata]NNG36359.1 helix-turn-helix transcriptional regulator [Nakamurella aerolata]
MPDAEGHPERSEIELGAVLSALADPLRRTVIRELLRAEDDVERTCTSFGLWESKSTRTHHFRVLRQAGLVRQVDRGNMRGVTLRRADLAARFPGLLELIAGER